MPHDPAQLRSRARRERLGERVLVGGCVHADLDQLVIAKGLVDRPDHRIGGSGLADLHQRLELVSARAQEAALEAAQAGAGLFAHRAAHSTGSAPALAAFVLWFGLACATGGPPAAVAELRMPRRAELPAAHPPVGVDGFALPEAAPLLDQAPPESASLIYARAVLEAKASRLDAVQREGVARALVRAEAEHGLSVLITLALVEQESRFDPHAHGPSGSLGLMQVQPATARDVARRHGLAWQSDRTLFDPVQNVRIATAYLAEMRALFGSTDHALAAYNIGPGNLRRLLGRRPFRHGPYLRKVHAKAEALRAEYGEPELAIGG